MTGKVTTAIAVCVRVCGRNTSSRDLVDGGHVVSRVDTSVCCVRAALSSRQKSERENGVCRSRSAGRTSVAGVLDAAAAAVTDRRGPPRRRRASAPNGPDPRGSAERPPTTRRRRRHTARSGAPRRESPPSSVRHLFGYHRIPRDEVPLPGRTNPPPSPHLLPVTIRSFRLLSRRVYRHYYYYYHYTRYHHIVLIIHSVSRVPRPKSRDRRHRYHRPPSRTRKTLRL